MSDFPAFFRMMQAFGADPSSMGHGAGHGGKNSRNVDKQPASYRFIGELAPQDKIDLLAEVDSSTFTRIGMRTLKLDVRPSRATPF